MEWNKKAVYSLIDMYHEKPELWDSKNVHYRSRIKKQAAWVDISTSLCVPRYEVEQKMRKLVGQFHREYKKANMQAEGRSKWFAYDKLFFLTNTTVRSRRDDARSASTFQEQIDRDGPKLRKKD
ncbi:hypothetical protein J6590_077026 [Homalodisca vitripennis]|nr:hypothetical protein J6590_077026 [Homalodisca vitripennis]